MFPFNIREMFHFNIRLIILSPIMRCISLTSFTCLRIVIAVTRTVPYLILDICGIIEEAFQLNLRRGGRRLTFEPSDDIPTISNNTISSTVSCQTEESTLLHNESGSISRPGLLICDLDRTKIITISNNEATAKSSLCDNCQLQIVPILFKRNNDAHAIMKDSSHKHSFERNLSHSEHRSNMSVDKNSSNAEIETSQNTFCRKSFNSIYNVSDYSSDKSSEDSDYSTTLVLTDNGLNDSYINESGEFLHEANDLCSHRTYPISKARVSWCESEIKCSSEKFPNSSSEDNESMYFSDMFNNQSSFKSNSSDQTLVNNGVKQRLSSSNLDKSYLKFKKIKNEIIEETLRNTPRHEKSITEIKYPYSHEIEFIITDDSKDMLSASSYESLPVSDHIRNSFECSALYSLCEKNFLSASTPDFSTVDDFVEKFEQMKSSLSVSQSIQSKFSTEKPVSSPEQNEVKIFRTQSCDFQQVTKLDEKTKSSNSNKSNFLSLDNLFVDKTVNSGIPFKQANKHKRHDLEFSTFTLPPNILISDNISSIKSTNIGIDKCFERSNSVSFSLTVVDNGSTENVDQSNISKSVSPEIDFNATDSHILCKKKSDEKETLFLDKNIILDVKHNKNSEHKNEIAVFDSPEENFPLDTTPTELKVFGENMEARD